MAIKLISWAFDQVCPTASSKAVLVKLADNANDQGECYPGLDYICRHTQLSRPTVIKSIKLLEAAGMLVVVREKMNGVNLPNRYLVGGSKAALPEPSPSEPSLNQVCVASDALPTNEARKEGSNGRGTRLAESWEPSPANIEYARSKGHDDRWIEHNTELFRNHWLAKSGKDATKVDWCRTWQTWCLNNYSGKSGGNSGSSPGGIIEAGARAVARLREKDNLR